MTFWTLIRRSLTFHFRSHLGVVLGAAIGTGALVGALLVGDSMRASLLRMSLQAIGPYDHALLAGDRFFTAKLSDAIGSAGTNSVEPVLRASALMVLQGVVRSPEGDARANQVQVLGIDPGFFQEAGSAQHLEFGEDEALLNESLARQLGVSTGDEILVRVPKPGALSREVTLTERENTDTSLRLRVAGLLSGDKGGNFSLQRSQLAPFNVFIKREILARAVELEGKANCLLVDVGRSEVSSAQLAELVHKNWTLADASLELREVGEAVELRSPRIFLDSPVIKAATAAASAAPRPVLTYLVNLLQADTKQTPYSFVSAAGPPWTPSDLKSNEIIASQWLSDDLQLKPGDEIALTYFLPESGAALTEATNLFVVRGVIPAEMPWMDKTLMPDFPGIEKAESTGDWEVGFELVHEIRPKDEEYWKTHRGTPKAFISPEAGQRLWANRFGELTALRWEASAMPATARQQFVTRLLEKLRPGEVGLTFEAVRERAIAAASQSQDFGQLFLGFSFFLVVAALLLVALLFQFGIEQRTSEVGTFLATGYTARQVARLLLYEGAALALFGSLLGAAAGFGYARLMLLGLTTLWRDATGASALQFSARPESVLGGIVAGVLVAIFAIWLTLRKLARQPALSLLSGSLAPVRADAKQGRGRARLLALTMLIAALVIVVLMFLKGEQANAGAFFGAGSLLLVAGLAGVAAWLHPSTIRRQQKPTLANLGLRAGGRRRKRSLAAVALLACGAFLIGAIGAFRLDATQDAVKPESGTGGFALIGASTMPVIHDLNSREGQEFYGLNAADLEGVRIIPLRVRQGDDASCLNLNRAQQPRLLGVQPEALAGRFTFARLAKGIDSAAPWLVLNQFQEADPDEIPAIGDANSIQWAMGKKVGDTLDYIDERGRLFRVRIVGAVANSILQGSLLIDEQAFVRKFPSEAGYRSFLVSAPADKSVEVSAALTRALQDVGLELTPAARRLNDFNAVQNTYLGAFQVLGGLGLLLGSAGLGIVVLRNVLERRGELGLLTAVGFSKGALRRLVLVEHMSLLVLGIGIGLGSALVAVLPALLSPGSALPYGTLMITLVAVVVNGLLWAIAATGLALRGNLLDALRND